MTSWVPWEGRRTGRGSSAASLGLDHARHRRPPRRVPELGVPVDAPRAGRARSPPLGAPPAQRVGTPQGGRDRRAVGGRADPHRRVVGARSPHRRHRAVRGEGTKADGIVAFANSDPAMVAFFCSWIRRFFDIDESRLRVSLYLHEGLDLTSAHLFWSRVTAIPVDQFRKPYRAVPDAGIRKNKHAHGCVSVRYACAKTHRGVMGLVRALLGSTTIPG